MRDVTLLGLAFSLVLLAVICRLVESPTSFRCGERAFRAPAQ